MSDALRSLSYEGTLVYLHDNKLETLRIVHRVEDGQVREQLVSLNGPVRTLTREKGRVTCELSNSHPISVPGHGVKRDLLHARAIDPGPSPSTIWSTRWAPPGWRGGRRTWWVSFPGTACGTAIGSTWIGRAGYR